MAEPNTVLPQFFPRPWEDVHDVFGIAFTEDVTVGFVIRGDGGYSYLLKTDAQAQGISHANLLSESLHNLAEMRDGAELKIARPLASTVAWVQAQDNFAAVRMLLPSVKSKLATWGQRSRHLLFYW